MPRTILFLFTALLFTMGCNSSDKERGRQMIPKEPLQVGIQPFIGFRADYIEVVKDQIEEAYGFKTTSLDPIPLDQTFFVNVKSPRYRADSIIRFLYREKPDSIDIMIGLTHHDISTTKRDQEGNVKAPSHKYMDWGIFGLGMMGRGSCVVSTFRLGRNGGKEKIVERIQKISLHEIGHTLGLPHCPNRGCFMEDAAETIKTVDRVGKTLCHACKKKID